MRYEVYEDPQNKEISVLAAGKGTFSATTSLLVNVIDASDWNECMERVHVIMDWEPYKSPIKKPSDDVRVWYTLRKRGEVQDIAVEDFVSRLSNLTPLKEVDGSSSSPE